MNHKTKRRAAWTASLLLLGSSFVFARLRVVATTQDMASLAQEVGGQAIDVDFISKGYQDPHFVEAKPSYLLKLNRADLLVAVGLELEVGWLPSLLTQARNSRILPGAAGYLDASQGCDILQKSAGTVDRSMGDVHPFGNPHYWTDPENGRAIVRNIAQKLSELDPSNASQYQDRLKDFESRLSTKEKEWKSIADSFAGLQVVTYHNSWPNFAKAFDIRVVNQVEPKPGIPPSPAHVQALIAQMKRDKTPLILMEPYFDDKLPRKIAAESGAKIVIFPPSVGGESGIRSYFDLFDHDLKLLQDAAGGRS